MLQNEQISLGSTWGRPPHVPYLSLTLYHTEEDLGGVESRRATSATTFLTIHELSPNTLYTPTSKLGPTKIASVRSRMQARARADVFPDGKDAGGNGKAAGAHAPAAPPPQAARPATRSA